ncbi:Flagellar M-ring protein FliF [hydrothermal vent metagenome]|uniref:Flagellar M-ring protein FliF n=1 Tax=hydrothermal vent metagenome TaxID=652676 RepID=A0A3B1B7I7_9ZZZZ
MDLVKSEQLSGSFMGMLELPVVRQVGLLVGLAASIAIGIGVVLWSQTPTFNILYSNVTAQDAQAMAEILKRNNIEFRLDPDSGAIMVESGKTSEAMLKLAAENLPQSSGEGFEIMDKEQGFGSSAFIQNIRYQRAREGELARTIMSITAVENARVHLALPKESAFVRNRKKPSASVMIKLAPGRRLEKEQIAAITHLVASSVTNLEASQVTLVDDRGRLLSSDDDKNDLAMTANEFEYTHKVEQNYIQRIERLLAPLVGLNGVRAQVNADLDFTKTESTQEQFNPDLPALRSEQQTEEQSSGVQSESGIPGALSNEPPGKAVAPEEVNKKGKGAEEKRILKVPRKSKKRSIRNFELDKMISHTRHSTGNIRRLSVAVVLDVKSGKDAEGNPIEIPYTDVELARFTSLVKEAVGFNAMRGDSVKVINAAFLPTEKMPEIPDIPIWEQSWFWSVLKQLAAAVMVIFLVFGVLRPIMRHLATQPKQILVNEEGEEIPEDQLTLSHETGGRLPKPTTYEDNLNMAKSMASQEPKRVAQVVKGWLED